MKENIIIFIKKFVNINNPQMNMDMDLYSSGIDSLTYINLVVEIEKEFNILFEEGMLDYKELNSINKISDYVKERIKGRICI